MNVTMAFRSFLFTVVCFQSGEALVLAQKNHRTLPSFRRRIHLFTGADDGDNAVFNDDSSLTPPSPPADSNSAKSLFEDAVRTVTGDKSYQFGDLTKRTISDLTGKNLAEEKYEFGDITKNMLNKAGQMALKDESYQFGDLTKKKLEELESTIEEWNFEKDPLDKIYNRFMLDMNPQQRNQVVIGAIQLGATALLTWGLFANFCVAFASTIAWNLALRSSVVSLSATASRGVISALPLLPLGPRTTSSLWRTFLAKYASVNYFLSPLFLVIKGAGTVLWVRRYNSIVRTLEQRISKKVSPSELPIVSKILALLSAFAIKNVMFSFAVGVVSLSVGGLLAKLWLRFALL